MSPLKANPSFWPHGVLFAALWSAGMVWWMEAREGVQIASVVIAGLFCGYSWVVLMRAFGRWRARS